MIHSTVLTGLEEGRANELLTGAYLKSFLKKYAQFLGLSSAELVKEYFPASSENAALNMTAQENIFSKETTDPPKFLYTTGLAIGAVILLVLFVFLTGKISSVLKKSAPAARKTSFAAAEKDPFSAAGKPRRKVTAVKTTPAPKEFIPKTAPLILEIRVKRAAQVKLKRDGVLLFKNVLAKGLTEKIVADNSIELDASRAESLELTLNGNLIKLPRRRGAFTIEITKNGVKFK
jgi:cytoskeletal protein RodZ